MRLPLFNYLICEDKGVAIAFENFAHFKNLIGIIRLICKIFFIEILFMRARSDKFIFKMRSEIAFQLIIRSKV